MSDAFPTGSLYGFEWRTYNYRGPKLSVAVGYCRDSTDSVNMQMERPSKVSFPADPGSWHIFAISKADGAARIIVDASLTPPIANDEFIRRIGSIFIRDDGSVPRAKTVGNSLWLSLHKAP